MLRKTLLATLCASALLNVAFTAHADGQKTFVTETGTITATPSLKGSTTRGRWLFCPTGKACW